ncbi:MAG: hypothetical protein ACD_73C00006G0003 [uncultured bacterium]|nr:MAG: hypothetical protein ACD_73C00006G0003 [uncultured bacterium]
MSKAFDELVLIMNKLLAPNGCPWDLKQTHETLIPYLIEEAYEVVDAIERKSIPDLKEELGDLLLQVVFHAALAQREAHFDVDHVAAGISEKLIRRHPHVFGTASCESAADVMKQWDEIKSLEKSGRDETILDSVPKSLPSLFEAYKISKKAAKTGFDWDDSQGILDKINEEIGELKQALENKDEANTEEELGDLLFSIVNWCRHQKIDPERALKKSNSKFRKRFLAMEKHIKNDNKKMETLDLAQWESYWCQAKADTK